MSCHGSSLVVGQPLGNPLAITSPSLVLLTSFSLQQPSLTQLPALLDSIDCMWRQCHTCGWWQKGQRPCEGCARGSSRYRSTARQWPKITKQPLATALLQDRWMQTRDSSQNPKHVQIEKFCCKCFLRTMGGNMTCRVCQSDLTSAMRILPGHWPPLSCPAHLVQRLEVAELPRAADPAMEQTGDVPMAQADNSVAERPMQALSLSQLKQQN